MLMIDGVAHFRGLQQIVYDATDGAIVIFGSPGSEIKNNRVISRTRMIMGGTLSVGRLRLIIRKY